MVREEEKAVNQNRKRETSLLGSSGPLADIRVGERKLHDGTNYSGKSEDRRTNEREKRKGGRWEGNFRMVGDTRQRPFGFLHGRGPVLMENEKKNK